MAKQGPLLVPSFSPPRRFFPPAFRAKVWGEGELRPPRGGLLYLLAALKKEERALSLHRRERVGKITRTNALFGEKDRVLIQIRHEWREGETRRGAGAGRGKKERGKRKVNNNVRIVDINKRQRQIMFLQSKFNRSPIVIIVGKR